MRKRGKDKGKRPEPPLYYVIVATGGYSDKAYLTFEVKKAQRGVHYVL